MSRPQFSAAGTDGGGQTLAMTRRPELDPIKIERTEPVAPGESESVEIYAPEDSTYRVVSLYLQAPPISGASGEHRIVVNATTGRDILQGESDSETAVRFKAGHWHAASEDQQPPSTAAQERSLDRLQASPEHPIEIQYHNNTDDEQTDARNYEVAVEEATY